MRRMAEALVTLLKTGEKELITITVELTSKSRNKQSQMSSEPEHAPLANNVCQIVSSLFADAGILHGLPMSWCWMQKEDDSFQ